MYKEKGTGRSKEEARRRAEEALKERLWRECWKEAIEVPRDAVEHVVAIEGGLFEVTIEI
jgi:hypothetical protein